MGEIAAEDKRFAPGFLNREAEAVIPSQSEFEEKVPGASVQTFVASKGTLIFCDTSGFHRGGHSWSTPRVLATATYSSPASLASLTERSYRFTGPLDGLDPPTRFALT